MPELSIDDHSEEVQEILGRIPKWIVRSGITLLFVLTSIILVGSYFIPYPESVDVPIRITTLNPPSPIIAKQGNNKINQWFAMNQQPVKKGQLIAVWQTEDDYLHVIELEKLLAKRALSPTQEFSDTLKLPSLSAEIRNYVEAFDKLRVVQQSINHLREINRLNNQLVQRTEYLRILQKQRQVKVREFGLLENKFRQDSIYYFDGGYGIGKRDYEGALLLFLQQKSAYYQYQASVVELNNSLEDLKNELQIVKEQREKDITTAKFNLDESLFLLGTKIEDWKAQNLIVSSINGRLDRTQFWSENQLITSGEIIGVVVPEDPMEIICKAVVNAESIGRLEEGQRVLIKLDGFNSQQYGSVEGIVSSVSEIPYNDEYQVRIDLINKLTTMDDLKIPFIQDLTGVAEILIDNSRLIGKLINFK